MVVTVATGPGVAKAPAIVGDVVRDVSRDRAATSTRVSGRRRSWGVMPIVSDYPSARAAYLDATGWELDDDESPHYAPCAVRAIEIASRS